MPVWRCPHCGTPQAESSRCWVCRRSTTTCATCLHFRRGIASGLGLCGLDPRHAALDGSEIRACWVAAGPPVADTADGVARDSDRRLSPLFEADRTPARTFVPVDELAGLERAVTPATADDEPATDDALVTAGPATGPNGWSLWGDPEP